MIFDLSRQHREYKCSGPSPTAFSSRISARSNMDSNKLDGAVPPTLHTTSIGHSGKRHNSILGLGTPKSDGRSVYVPALEDRVDTKPRPSALYTRPSIQSVLGNFFIAVSLISLIISLVFLAVTRLILRDARSTNLRVFSNTTGVNLYLYHDERTSLITVVIVINNRRQPSTGSGGIRIVHLMESALL